MKIAFYIKKESLRDDRRVLSLLENLRKEGHEVYEAADSADLREGTAMMLSLGGDGTFLCAASICLKACVPVLGINLGRMGFLSNGRIEDALEGICSGKYTIETRSILKVETEGDCAHISPYAFNEVSLLRLGPSMIGVDVQIDGEPLPTYWADGLLVATSSGSTAYNLSAGGPICFPGSRVMVVSPLAPHNLSVRPLVIGEDSVVKLTVRSRDHKAVLAVDNKTFEVGDGITVNLRISRHMLKTVSLGKDNFIEALKSRFFWGQDIRNTGE